MAHSPAAAGNAQPRTFVPAEGFVGGLLFFSILISFLVSIEPAPYEAFVFLLGGVLVIAGFRFNRALVPLIGLLAIWVFAGALSVMQTVDNPKALTYYAVSVYLGVTAFIFACIFSENSENRLALLHTSYVLAGFIAAILGIIGYFGNVEMFLLNGRSTATFKDPNVFGPFLILPLLFLVQDVIYRGFRVFTVVVAGVTLIGLFLSFSRGAWGHFLASALLMLALMFWTNRDRAFRWRMVRLSVVTAGSVAVLLVLLVSFGSIGAMLEERANLINYYDGGEHGRFGSQLQGLLAIFSFPNGLGPKQFYATFGMDPHNVYLAALYAYGWLGGVAYATLVVMTLYVGFRGLRVKTPWQPGLIAIYATFVGLVLEGFIIDTDHWRHYFLLLGGIWGLSVASLRPKMA